MYTCHLHSQDYSGPVAITTPGFAKKPGDHSLVPVPPPLTMTWAVPGSGYGSGALINTLVNSTPCFTAGTQVVLSVDADGHTTTKNIKDIKVGDTVLARSQDDPNDSLEQRTVTAVSVHTVYHLRLVKIRQPGGGIQTIRTTDDHPFYVKGRGWVLAKDLRKGQRLYTADGHLVRVLKTRVKPFAKGIAVYNLSVDQDHTFFVASKVNDEAVWVHNTDPNQPNTRPAGNPNAPAKSALPNPDRLPDPLIDFGPLPLPDKDRIIQDIEDHEFEKYWHDKLAQEQMEKDYQAGYDRALAAGHSAPDPKLAWLPVIGGLDQARFEYQAGHKLGAVMQAGRATFEVFFFKPLGKAGMRPSPAARAASVANQAAGVAAARGAAAAETAGETAKVATREFVAADSQVGAKIGKHAKDFGLDPSNPAHRAQVRALIERIGRMPEKTVTGTFSGQGAGGARGLVQFRIIGNDVVVTTLDGEFITLLKDGVTQNQSVMEALRAVLEGGK